jgi:hypothetical protein
LKSAGPAATLIVALTLAGCASSASQPGGSVSPSLSGWIRQGSATEGFSLALPPGWKVKLVPSGRFTAVDAANPSVHAAMDVTGTAEASDILSYLSAVTTDQHAIEQQQQTTVARQRSDLPAGRTEKLIYSYTAQTSSGPVPLTFVEYIVFKSRVLKSSVFHLTFVSASDQSARLQPVFAQIAGTLELR